MFTIRKATTADCALIQKLAQQIFPVTYKDILTPEQTDYMMEWMYSLDNIRKQMEEEGHVYFLAYEECVAILAMVLSLVIFVINRKKFPDPSKKVAAKAGDATAVEMNAQEVRQRMYALFAVFGVVIFFWFSFHQNGLTLTYFAKEYTDLNLFGKLLT